MSPPDLGRLSPRSATQGHKPLDPPEHILNLRTPNPEPRTFNTEPESPKPIRPTVEAAIITTNTGFLIIDILSWDPKTPFDFLRPLPKTLYPPYYSLKP